MAIQTSVASTPAVAIEGMGKGDANVEHTISLEVDANNGRLVVMGTADGRGKLPTAAVEITGGKALGVTRYQPMRMVNWPAGVSVPFPNGSTAPLIRRGLVWVKVEEAVAQGDPVFVRHASGAGGTALGAFRKSADTTTAAQLPGAVYRTSASANGLALVEVNLP